MKVLDRLLNPRFANQAARVLKCSCDFVVGFCVVCMLLSCLGRQSFLLHAKTGIYYNAIYAEENHDPQARSLTTSMPDEVHIWTNAEDKIDLRTQIGLSLMHALQLLPFALGFWYLGRVFSGVGRGEIFTAQNARYILYFGLLQLFSAVCVPFLKLSFVRLINLISSSRIFLSTGQTTLSGLWTGIALAVAAYIVRYGVYLQDEVDQTV